MLDAEHPVIDVPLFLKLTVPNAPAAVAPLDLIVALKVTV
jgi:hypothetical protein